MARVNCNFSTVHSQLSEHRFHACMRICAREATKGAPLYEQKGAAKQRKASQRRFMTIECSRSVHSIVLRMALCPGLLQIAQMIMGIALPIQLHQDIGRSSALLPRVGNAARVDCRHVRLRICKNQRAVRMSKHHDIDAPALRFFQNRFCPNRHIIMMSMGQPDPIFADLKFLFLCKIRKKSLLPATICTGQPAMLFDKRFTPSTSPQWIKRSICPTISSTWVRFPSLLCVSLTISIFICFLHPAPPYFCSSNIFFHLTQRLSPMTDRIFFPPRKALPWIYHFRTDKKIGSYPNPLLPHSSQPI